MRKSNKAEAAGAEGTRAGSDADTRRVVRAAREFIAANTASKEAATDKLKELGILDEDGNLSKNYR